MEQAVVEAMRMSSTKGRILRRNSFTATLSPRPSLRRLRKSRTDPPMIQESDEDNRKNSGDALETDFSDKNIPLAEDKPIFEKCPELAAKYENREEKIRMIYSKSRC